MKVTYKRGTQMYVADTLSRVVACSDKRRAIRSAKDAGDDSGA